SSPFNKKNKFKQLIRKNTRENLVGSF
ncbi:MAG: hypothetical protein ACI9K4_001518, partial [Polaribacter sp.]